MVELTKWTNNKQEEFWAQYEKIEIASAAEKYQLHVYGFNQKSTAGDSLGRYQIGTIWSTSHNGSFFSTKDRDNDKYYGNCAEELTGGWWYDSCQVSHPTGKYMLGYCNKFEPTQGITWYTLTKSYECLPYIHLILMY